MVTADLFLADGEQMRDGADRLRPFAAQYCRGCPVLHQCRAQPEQFGVWGGELRHRGKVIDLLAAPVTARPAR